MHVISLCCLSIVPPSDLRVCPEIISNLFAQLICNKGRCHTTCIPTRALSVLRHHQVSLFCLKVISAQKGFENLNLQAHNSPLLRELNKYHKHIHLQQQCHLHLQKPEQSQPSTYATHLQQPCHPRLQKPEQSQLSAYELQSRMRYQAIAKTGFSFSVPCMRSLSIG